MQDKTDITKPQNGMNTELKKEGVHFSISSGSGAPEAGADPIVTSFTKFAMFTKKFSIKDRFFR